MFRFLVTSMAYDMCMIIWSSFFFKQKTAYELRISVWSSDVCSSDLGFEDRLDRQVAAFERPFHDEGELGFDARLDEAIGRDDGAIVERHAVEQHPRIRRVDRQRALHRLGGEADFPAHDAITRAHLGRDP